MAKKVRYNGGTQSYYGCSKPTLKGVDGEFNSVWFDEVDDKVYIAIAHELPEIGKRESCYKIEFIDGQPKLIGCFTSTVKGINYMGNNIYQVTTHNSVYIVKVV